MALTIRLNSDDEKLILKLQQHFDVKTASRAMLLACHSYENFWKRNYELLNNIDELEKELSRCKRIIEDFQRSFRALSDFEIT